MPQNHPPVDPNVTLPPAVLAAAARSEAIHAQAYDAPAPASAPAAPPAFMPPVAEPVPQPQPQPQPTEPAPQPVTAPVTPPAPAAAEPKPIDWEARFNAMKGRYDQSVQTIGDLQGQISAMGDELQQRLRAQPPQPPQPVPTITEEDRKTFGEDLIGLAERVARGVVAQAVTPLEQRTSRLGQQVQQTTVNSVYALLDAEIPDWRAINASPRFKAWSALRDVYSGGVRSALLMDAFRRGDAPRVLAFFKGFVTDEQATGQMPGPEPSLQPPAPGNAAVPLAALSTPGRPHPGGDTAPTDAKPVFTRADIRWFYSPEGQASYYGRPDARKADEARIFEAQREGRIR